MRWWYYWGFRPSRCFAEHLPKCLPAMAHRQLLLFRSFAKGAAERRVIEERIITEAAGAARGVEHIAFHCAFVDAADLAASDKSDHAHEPRPPVGHAAQPFEQ